MTPARLLVFAFAAALAGGTLPAQEPYPVFTPRAGFEGRTEGNGTLRLLFFRPRPFHVESRGFDRPDGTMQLDQTISAQGRKPHDRTFVLREVGPYQYAGTLTDAAGPVALRTDGNRLTLRYRYKGPFVVHQTMDLSPDGRTIDNTGKLTLLGIPLGRLKETITRKD